MDKDDGHETQEKEAQMKAELTAIEITLAPRCAGTENLSRVSRDGKVRLTIEEAKALYRQLHDLFGEKVVTIHSEPIVIERWPTNPNYPQITYTTAAVDPFQPTEVR